MSGTPRPAATMRRTRALFAYSCCCAREHGHDAEACCQAWAVVAADRLCPLLVDTGPLLVDIGEGAVGPVRTVDDSPRPALFPVHAHLLPTGKVMIWPGDGGISGNDPRLWNPADASVTVLAKPGYDLFCSGHAFLADGRLFVAGGHIQNFVGLNKAYLYNPFSNTWAAAPDMNAPPDMNSGRWYPAVTTLANGDALVVSGV